MSGHRAIPGTGATDANRCRRFKRGRAGTKLHPIQPVTALRRHTRQSLRGASSNAGNAGSAGSFQLLNGAWPVRPEETGQLAIGEDLATGLAARAVVGLAVGVLDALYRRLALRTGLSVAPMRRHLLAEGGHLLGESIRRFQPQTLDP